MCRVPRPRYSPPGPAFGAWCAWEADRGRGLWRLLLDFLASLMAHTQGVGGTGGRGRVLGPVLSSSPDTWF